MQTNPAPKTTPAPAAAAPAKPSPKAPLGGPRPHVGLSAQDLIAQIEADPETFGHTPDSAIAKEPSEEGLQTPEGEQPPSRAKDAKAKKDEPTPPANDPLDDPDDLEGEEEGKVESRKSKDEGQTAELSAEQSAWLEKRAGAKTPEEAAEIDKTAPEFSDEQWALAEKQFTESREGREGGEGTAELTQLRAESSKLKADFDTQSKRLKDLEAELAQAQVQPVAIAPMHPLMTADAEGLAQAERNAYALKKWCAENWDGTEAIPAAGDQPAQPAYSAAQVRKASANADETLQRIIPAARQYQQLFDQENAEAQQVYPGLFDANAEALMPGALNPHQTRTNILRRLPGLKAGLPQISKVMGDSLLGETIRVLIQAETRTPEVKALADALVKAAPALAKFMPALTGAKTGGKAIGKLPAKPIVPLARPSAGGRSIIPRPGAKTGKHAPDPKKFQTLLTENGGDQLAALTETMRNVTVD